MAPAIKFTKHDVRRLLDLATTREVDRLVELRILAVAGYRPAGRPLFDLASVCRAARHVVREVPPEP
jgi:hypothetical protein